MARRKVTVQEAAERLDASVDAVRQRIKREKLQRAEPDDPRDTRVYVWLDHDQTESRHKVEGEDGSADGNGRALVESLQDQVSYLREQLAAERRANDENRRLLLAALDRIPPQLEAPQEAQDAPAEAPEGSGPRPTTGEAQGGAQEAERVGFWRRLFGG
jgi:DNA-directed RNA polymerase specialized sigma24 family protein